MHWNLLAGIAVGWCTAACLVAWGVGRWFQAQRALDERDGLPPH